jgi:hypothetical protein
VAAQAVGVGSVAATVAGIWYVCDPSLAEYIGLKITCRAPSQEESAPPLDDPLELELPDPEEALLPPVDVALFELPSADPVEALPPLPLELDARLGSLQKQAW